MAFEAFKASSELSQEGVRVALGFIADRRPPRWEQPATLPNKRLLQTRWTGTAQEAPSLGRRCAPER